MREVRLFPLRWVVVTALAFLFSYFFLPRPAHVIQLEWPWDSDDGRVWDKVYMYEQPMEELKLNAFQNWTHSFATSNDMLHHPHRFKFIYSRKRLNVTARAKVNLIPGQIKWLHDPDHLCRTAHPPPLALALVVSAVGHHRRRTFIRNTWARAAWYPHTRLKVVFVLGTTVDAPQQESVEQEARIHGDIVQYNFIDSYANLTYKSLSLLTWGTTRCPEASFLAKIDDDVLVNPFHLQTFLQKSLRYPPSPEVTFPKNEMFQAPPNTNAATTYIYGRYDARPFPLRSTKWALSVDEYPEKVFPPFVHGPAYILGRAVAKELLRVAPYVPLVKLEDVYMTGLVAHAAGVSHVQIFGSVSTFEAEQSLYKGTQAILEETGRQGRKAAWKGILKFAPKV